MRFEVKLDAFADLNSNGFLQVPLVKSAVNGGLPFYERLMLLP